MAERRVWEKVNTRRYYGDIVDTLEEILSLGMISREPQWMVTYEDKVTGKTVTGYGKTLEEADKDAQSKLW